MEIIIVTGMSGAGKSSVLNILEDFGYYCMDNVPTELILDFARITSKAEKIIDKIAVGIDVRGFGFYNMLSELDKLEASDFKVSVIFLDADDRVLVKRFKEARRLHPMAKTGNLLDGIKKERKSLAEIKNRADHIVDTSQLNLSQLKSQISKIYLHPDQASFVISIVSFGFKYGILLDADLVFDVRFLPNPYYKEDLRDFSGQDESIKDYVLSSKLSKKYLDLLMDLLNFSIPQYKKEGKANLIIGFGCTGGKHRSVVVANYVYQKLKKTNDLVYINNRDERYW